MSGNSGPKDDLHVQELDRGLTAFKVSETSRLRSIDPGIQSFDPLTCP